MLKTFISLVVTIAIAYAGGFILFKFRVPGGFLLGAMASVIAYNMLTDGATYLPYATRLIAQVIIGAYLGFSLTNYSFSQIFRLIPFVLIILVSMLLMGTLTAFVATRITNMSPVTAMIATMPGGISEAPLIAIDMEADPTSVIALQFVRLVAGIGIFPMLIKLTRKYMHNLVGDEETNHGVAVSKKLVQEPHKNSLLNVRNQTFSLIVASFGGYLGKMLNFPASVIICSMVFVVLLKPLIPPAQISKPLMQAAQLMTGAYLGCSINYQDLYHLSSLIFPALLLIILFGINCFLTSVILHKIFKVNINTALLMASPAGGSEMALIAADLGSSNTDITDLVLVHILRVIIVIITYPTLVILISPWL